MTWNLFGCSHQRMTFPQTPKRQGFSSGGSYVVCLECGKEFAYNWGEMRVEKEISRSPEQHGSGPCVSGARP